jgi:3-dehydroquinate synthase
MNAPLLFSEPDAFRNWAVNKKVSAWFVLTDQNTHRDCLSLFSGFFPFQFREMVIPAGEQNKHLETCTQVWDFLTREGADRNAVMINLGGGVVLDLGGFCASVYKRGIRFVHIPTSLLAQVDAAHGGKTGVDFQGLKNHIGSFRMAESIFIDSRFLQTLPAAECLSGLAEMVKHLLIGSPSPNPSQIPVQEVVSRPEYQGSLIRASVAIKQSFILLDPLEKGIRKTLNFGHTLGHALESYYLELNQPVSHGLAIASGMIVALWLSVEKVSFPVEKMHLWVKFLRSNFPLKYPGPDAFPRLLSLMEQDKKNDSERLIFSLLRDTGVPEPEVVCSYELVESAFHFLNHDPE